MYVYRFNELLLGGNLSRLHIFIHVWVCWDCKALTPIASRLFICLNVCATRNLESWDNLCLWIKSRLVYHKKEKFLKLEIALCANVPQCATQCPSRLHLTPCVSSWDLGAKETWQVPVITSIGCAVNNKIVCLWPRSFISSVSIMELWQAHSSACMWGKIHLLTITSNYTINFESINKIFNNLENAKFINRI